MPRTLVWPKNGQLFTVHDPWEVKSTPFPGKLEPGWEYVGQCKSTAEWVVQNVETAEVDTVWRSHLAKTSTSVRGTEGPPSVAGAPAPKKSKCTVKACCETKHPESVAGPQAPQTTQSAKLKKPKRLPGSIPVPCRNKKGPNGLCRMMGKCWFQHPHVSPEPFGTRPDCRYPPGKCPFKDRCRYRHRNLKNVKRAEGRKKKKAEEARLAAAEKRNSPAATVPAGPATAPAGPAAAQPAPATPRMIPIPGLAPGVGAPGVEPSVGTAQEKVASNLEPPSNSWPVVAESSFRLHELMIGTPTDCNTPWPLRPRRCNKEGLNRLSRFNPLPVVFATTALVRLHGLSADQPDRKKKYLRVGVTAGSGWVVLGMKGQPDVHKRC